MDINSIDINSIDINSIDIILLFIEYKANFIYKFIILLLLSLYKMINGYNPKYYIWNNNYKYYKYYREKSLYYLSNNKAK